MQKLQTPQKQILAQMPTSEAQNLFRRSRQILINYNSSTLPAIDAAIKTMSLITGNSIPATIAVYGLNKDSRRSGNWIAELNAENISLAS